jgi:3-hydroxyisobutyrate dehydrogenase
MARIAFIGLGRMGAPMAANLTKSQHKVVAYDIVAAARDGAAKDGIEIAADARAAVKDAEIVVTMLPVGEHVVSAWTEILPAVPAGALMIDCSTIDVASALKAHEMAKARGLPCIDAPVSGGVPGAVNATLTFMIGGDPAVFERAKPVILAMGQKAVHCGVAGMGQAAKICNNMVAAIAMIGTSEAFLLAEKLGLDKRALHEVASTSSGQSWAVTKYCPAPGLVAGSPSDNDYKAGFMAQLMLKDLKLAQAAANSVRSPTPLGAEAAALLQLYVNKGYGEKDFSGIYELLAGKV